MTQSSLIKSGPKKKELPISKEETIYLMEILLKATRNKAMHRCTRGLTKLEQDAFDLEKIVIADAKRSLRNARKMKLNRYSLCFPSYLSKIFSSCSRKKSKAEIKEIESLKVKKIYKLKATPFDKLMTIRVKPNNMFCTLTSVQRKKKVLSSTASKYRIKMSKKALKYNYKLILNSFYKEAKQFIGKKMLISIVAPKRIRRDLMKILKKKLYRQKRKEKEGINKIKRVALFYFKAKKCFNGCRARKKKRSKQRGSRIYK